MGKKNQKRIERGGVIPYYVDNGEVKMMFMKPSDPKHGGDDFQIAKGKIEPGEDSRTGAYREASEELGLFKGNVEKDWYLGTFLGRIHIYLAKIKDPKMFGDPMTKEEVAQTGWMTIEQFEKWGRKIHVPVVKAAFRKIMREENTG